jgi:hypothetical protein
LVRITGEPDDIRVWDEMIVNYMLCEKIKEMNEAGIVIRDPQQVLDEKQRLLEEYTHMGRDRYLEVKDKIDFALYNVEILITNEEIDVGVVTQNLLAALKLAPQYQTQVMEQLFDIMGLDFKPSTTPNPQAPAGAPGSPMAPAPGPMGQGVMAGTPQVPSQNPQQVVTNANVQ